VPTGSVYGFIGPDGSGKTTTLRMIMRIFHPDSGRLRVLGEDARRMPPHRTGSVICRRSGLYRKMVISDVLRFFAELKGTRPRRPRSTVGWRGWGWKAMAGGASKPCRRACHRRCSSSRRCCTDRSC
jgi:ABC-2 type transport system ATP-binding protein